MARVKYAGPSLTGVLLPLPDGREVHVDHDSEVPLDLPDDFAKALLEQSANWQPVGRKKQAANREEE